MSTAAFSAVVITAAAISVASAVVAVFNFLRNLYK
jgi:hypothetical protein